MHYYKNKINAARGNRDLNAVEREIWHDGSLEAWQKNYLTDMIQKKHNVIKGGK